MDLRCIAAIATLVTLFAFMHYYSFCQSYFALCQICGNTSKLLLSLSPTEDCTNCENKVAALFRVFSYLRPAVIVNFPQGMSA